MWFQGHSARANPADIERRLSQLSDNDVEAVVAKAMEEVSRRNSGGHGHRRISPQMSLTVPDSALAPSAASPASSTHALHLAPPSEGEMQAQRRFSEVNAAIERHNSRRQAKQRSQSVMYRNKRRTARRNSDVRDPNNPNGNGDQFLNPNLANAQVNLAGAVGAGGQQQHHRVIPGLQPPASLHATLSAPSMQQQQPQRRYVE